MGRLNPSPYITPTRDVWKRQYANSQSTPRDKKTFFFYSGEFGILLAYSIDVFEKR